MNREFFNQQFAALANAYTIGQKLSDETQDVYWEMLKDIPEAKFALGVRDCLARCKFFPTIAELGDASMPPVRDYKAPLPPVDKPFATLNWRQQIERAKELSDLRGQKRLTAIEHGALDGTQEKTSS